MRTYTGLCTLGFDGIKASSKAQALKVLRKLIRKQLKGRKAIIVWQT